MFIRTLRRSFKRQEGQALVLACLTVLILSVAVITTVNLGHTVHEKIRLQNNADAAAYSMAAMEARAFNFYAFTNRTQASHYVNAMILHSVVSFAFFIEAFMTDLYAIVHTLYPCADPQKPFWYFACKALEAVPYVGAVFKIINQIMQALKKVLKALQKVFQTAGEHGIDRTLGRYVIPGYRLLNGAMAAASTAIMAATAEHVLLTSSEIITANDKDALSLVGTLSMGALSACMFDRAHFKEANGKPSSPRNSFKELVVGENKDNNKEVLAKRTMGQIANATRYACANAGGFNLCPDTFVTTRTLSDQLPSPVDKLGFLLEDAIMPKWGQTRFLGYNTMKGREQAGKGWSNWIHTNNTTPNVSSGPIASGDGIGADDLYTLKFGPEEIDIVVVSVDNPFNCKKGDHPAKCHGDPRYGAGTGNNKEFGRMLETSVWAAPKEENFKNDGGIHYRVAYRSSDNPTICKNKNCGWVPPGYYPRSWPYQWGPMSTSTAANEDADVGINRFRHRLVRIIGVVTVDIDLYVANIRGIEDGNHKWQGIMPFSHFEPGDYEGFCLKPGNGTPSLNKAAERKEEFNQPSTWVGLNKNAQKMRNPNDDGAGVTSNVPALLNDTGTINFSFTGSGSTKLEMENTKSIGIAPFDLEGINVISRGQAYYHRPGNWTEQPNFFNPYWRPRLASVWQGKYAIPVVNDVVNKLPAPLNNFGQKIITH